MRSGSEMGRARECFAIRARRSVGPSGLLAFLHNSFEMFLCHVVNEDTLPSLQSCLLIGLEILSKFYVVAKACPHPFAFVKRKESICIHACVCVCLIVEQIINRSRGKYDKR